MRYKEASLSLEVDDQVITWPGYSFGVPGLAVCKAMRGDPKQGYKAVDREWQLIHVSSGKPIGTNFPSRGAAAGVGQKLFALWPHWSSSAEEILANGDLMEKARDVVYGEAVDGDNHA